MYRYILTERTWNLKMPHEDLAIQGELHDLAFHVSFGGR